MKHVINKYNNKIFQIFEYHISAKMLILFKFPQSYKIRIFIYKI